MIDTEDFKALGKELTKIKQAHPEDEVLYTTVNRMIVCMRNYVKPYDIKYRTARRSIIGRRLMLDLAWVTTFQWTH